ncbi:hypothetical protein SAMN05444002_1261 [Vannielia litorea]|uniref:Uncharacterized protein n=1 Tax=Vannielia litorea TaxID=1217970 RepID=A0A1N6F0L1_9RHOB|nr:hypothetical protein SAMN05444002_1261 [Vannielia litorea]
MQAEALAEDVAFWHKTGAGPGVAAVMTCPRGRLGEVIFLPEGSESETLQGIRELADKQPNPMSGGFLGFKGQMGRLVASAGGSIDVTDADFGACVCAALAAAK